MTPVSAAKYEQVFEVMRERIESGNYQPGTRIPSEAFLIQEFGVSRPTVARAMRDLERRGLVSRRRGAGTYVMHTRSGSKQFGLLIPGLGATEVFEPICAAMAQVAQRCGHTLLWGAATIGKSTEELQVDKGAIAWELCQQFIRDRVSGVFFAPLEMIPDQQSINERIAGAFAEADIPVVLLDRDYVSYPGRSKHDLVGVNNRRVGHAITSHLFDVGCERLLFVLRPGSANSVHARVAGFTEAFLTHRLPFDIQTVHECEPQDTDYIRAILRKHRPDGIVCGNDVTAGRLLHTLDEIGVRVPRDLKIAGVDGVPYADLLRVPLTTVRQPFAAIGDAAYHAMLDRIKRPHIATRQITLDCELVVRESTSPAE
jgi:GntR family transcriptional regulator, arabinose operon transcriptional repressor